MRASTSLKGGSMNGVTAPLRAKISQAAQSKNRRSRHDDRRRPRQSLADGGRPLHCRHRIARATTAW
jgi:hypothetical protein